MSGFLYVLSGKVLPERADVTIGPIKDCNIRVPELSIEFSAAIAICASQIMVGVRSEESIDDWETLRNIVEAVVRNIVDAFGFIEGRGYDVELTSIAEQSGRSMVFSVEVAALQEDKANRPITFPELYNLLRNPSQRQDDDLAFKTNQLRRALADLRESIRSPYDTGFFCYRAIECIRQCFIDPGKEDNDTERKLSWERMGAALCIAETWADDLKRISIPQRHGGLAQMPAKERVEAMQCAWKVVDRFILYAKNGFRPLSIEILE
jgi:hypothetical protein